MIKKCKNIFSKIINAKLKPNDQTQDIANTSLQAPHAQNSTNAKKKQDVIILLLLGALVVIGLIFMKYQANKASNIGIESEAKLPLNLVVASDALDIDKMWRNHFEDKLMDAKNQSNEKLKLIESSINEQSVAYTNQLKGEIERLKAQMQYITEEQESARREFNNARIKSTEDDRATKTHHPLIDDSRITVNHLDRGERFDRPKSARSYIPETAYVKGVLLGGIVVSTSIGSASEPVPVIIRITDRGNLPQNFDIDRSFALVQNKLQYAYTYTLQSNKFYIKFITSGSKSYKYFYLILQSAKLLIDITHCQIMGSSYGDLSSERAVIRAEVLSCKDSVNELIYTTKIAGLIYGDDGMNGIKGKVVQTSSKHLKNAMIGGVISGFAGAAKGQDQVIVSSFGMGSTKKKNMGDMLQEGGFAGASNAAEKIADYYIKQAESMSPVLLVSGGTKVDIVFTKGVYLGALDVQEKLQQYRVEKAKK